MPSVFHPRPSAVSVWRSAAVTDANDGPSPGANEYRRQARRLRKVYADQPERLHRSLRELSQKRDTDYRRESQGETKPVVRRMASSIPAILFDPTVPQSVIEAFADRVARQLDGQILRYSERLALLESASRMGIGRFHANLIIAAAQHQCEDRGRKPAANPSGNRLLPAATMLVLLVQSAIALGVWFMLR